jgi:hypothetical protein
MSQSTTTSSQTVYLNNYFDSTYYQNNTKLSLADLLYPLPTQWVSFPNLFAVWANAKCAAGLGPQLDPADAVVTAAHIGVQRTWEPCGHNGGVELIELSNMDHTIGVGEQAAGYRFLGAADAWFAVN